MATIPASSPISSSRSERVPPQDLDAEMALLGSMMMSRDAISEVIPILSRGDSRWFYLPVHQRLFEVLLDLYDDPAKQIDLLIVSDELRRRDLFEFVGGHEYMIQLGESFSDAANAEYYARLVRDKGMLRDLIQCCGEISESAFSGLDEAREILDLAERKVFQVTERRVAGSAIQIRDALVRLHKQLDQGDEGVCTGLPTDFVALDEMTAGLQRGDLIIVAARPSMGKTAFGLAMAKNIAFAGHPAVFFSMEMSAQQVAERLACSYGHGLDSHRLRKRMLSEEEKRDLCDACAAFQDVVLLIDDTPGMSAMELRSKARRMKLRYNIEGIFVDYLQLMHTPKAENRQVEMATVSRNLKSLARELEVPVVALAQLNRMPEGRSDKRPLMSDLRESGAIEQDADVVLLLHREEYYDYKQEKPETHGIAEIIIAKQRNGPTGVVQLHFDKKSTRFTNLTLGPEPAGLRIRRDDAPF